MNSSDDHITVYELFHLSNLSTKNGDCYRLAEIQQQIQQLDEGIIKQLLGQIVKKLVEKN